MEQIRRLGLYVLWITLVSLLAGCVHTPESEPVDVKIAVDKPVIKANGTDKAVFTVTANGVDITSAAIITRKGDPEPIPGAGFSTRIPAVYTFYATYDGQTSNEITIEATEMAVVITADRTAIKANDKDRTTFTVTADDQDVTAQATVILAEGETETTLDKASFSTKTAGAYTFHALYDGQKSNEITVEATEVALVITVDRAEIKANDKDMATFTVTADGQDVTALATVILAEGETETALEQASFSTGTAGAYTFYAVYDEQKSNEISINASDVNVMLTVDKPSIRADGKTKATFTVTADGEDITSSASIFIKGDDWVEMFEGTTFSTDEPGVYRFYATCDDGVSEEIQIEATFVKLTFLKQYLIMQFSGTVCQNCPLMTQAIQSVQEEYAGRMIHTICLHLYGKHCHSTLAGAIYQTANALSSDIYFPSTLVDLRDEVPLYPTTTPRELMKALDYSAATPAETGIAIRSQVNGSSIDFTVKIKTTQTDNYYFYAFVVEDRIKHRQALPDGTWDTDYIHDNVATYLIAEGDPKTGVNMGVIESGREVAGAFSIETADFDAKRTVDLSNCRIVGYTLKKIDDVYYIDNVVNVPVNGSAGYVYK
ncbi:MAG: Omp28-related outer membrane protein [Tannerella sp.]|jgi:hypothetical protein|nr:Omp28-related outer membrane protein [Tannerella sp.]